MSGEMGKPVTSFSGEYRFLSNFYPCYVTGYAEYYDERGDLQHICKGVPSVEHAYQARKFLLLSPIQMIFEAEGASEAKRLARKFENLFVVNKDWHDNKLSVMDALLFQKFHPGKPSNAHLVDKLLATGTAELVEGNTWGDTYWGMVQENGKWVGQNWLGKLLMLHRDRLSDMMFSTK